ncbi:hypothetical protein E2C01_040582 [Portunus trituberculatus]|uniref:Uncharacterized protein n=1 Tax=Portunus trituberculatus TaxID=210409 RepID=A0A5B7FK64_PORTR|nr:hypothetical protein [Portunus trituberculatus]
MGALTQQPRPEELYTRCETRTRTSTRASTHNAASDKRLPSQDSISILRVKFDSGLPFIRQVTRVQNGCEAASIVDVLRSAHRFGPSKHRWLKVFTGIEKTGKVLPMFFSAHCECIYYTLARCQIHF